LATRLAEFSLSKPRASPSRRRNRQGTEEALIAAAASIFAQKGYEAATTRGIAEAAGCSEGLIQRYFVNKEGLLLAVLRTEKADGDYSRAMEPLKKSIAEEVREIFSNAVKSMAEHSERMRVVLARVLVEPAFRADFNRIAVRSNMANGLEARLKRYVEIGLVDEKLDMRVVTELLLSLGFQLGFVHPQLHQTPAPELQKLIENYAMFVERAVSPRNNGVGS
jgi:AcrR family transcriptional regulator